MAVHKMSIIYASWTLTLAVLVIPNIVTIGAEDVARTSFS